MRWRTSLISRIAPLLLIAATLPAPRAHFGLWATPAAKAARAMRFDVDIHLASDGSAQVNETLLFDYTGGPFTFITRELPTDRTDGLTNFQASLDGAALPPGQQAGQVEIVSGNPMVVTWHFAPTSEATHTFQLSYRALGAVRQDPGADVFTWQILPAQHDYPITSSLVRVFFPSSVAMPSPPEALDSIAAIEAGPGQVTLTAQDIQPDVTLTAVLHFAPRSLASVIPQWQARESLRAALTRQNTPVFAGLSVLILLAGALGLVVFQRRYPVPRLAIPTTDSPPDDLPPALAGLLTGGLGAERAQLSGTLFDLARRGVLSMAEKAKGRWGQTSYQITLQAQPPGLRPHERAVLDVVFRAPAVGASVKLSEAGRRLGSGDGRISQALKTEAVALGYIDLGRARERRGLLLGALLALFVSLAGLLLGLGMREGLGDAVFLLPGTLFVVGVMGLIVGSALVPWSEAGWQAAARWKGFSAYLSRVVNGRAPLPGPDIFEQYLPYVASFGLAEEWVKVFSRQGLVPVLAWFRALAASADGAAGVVAMIAATSDAAAAPATRASAWSD